MFTGLKSPRNWETLTRLTPVRLTACRVRRVTGRFSEQFDWEEEKYFFLRWTMFSWSYLSVSRYEHHPQDRISLSTITTWSDQRCCIGERRNGRSIKLGVGPLIVREQDLVTATPLRTLNSPESPNHPGTESQRIFRDYFCGDFSGKRDSQPQLSLAWGHTTNWQG